MAVIARPIGGRLKRGRNRFFWSHVAPADGSLQEHDVTSHASPTGRAKGYYFASRSSFGTSAALQVPNAHNLMRGCHLPYAHQTMAKTIVVWEVVAHCPPADPRGAVDGSEEGDHGAHRLLSGFSRSPASSFASRSLGCVSYYPLSTFHAENSV